LVARRPNFNARVGQQGRRSKSPARLRLFPHLGHCNCAATTVVRNNFLSFRILPPLGRSSGGNHAFNFVETLHREGSGGIGPRTVTASAQIIQPVRHRADPHSRAQVLGHGKNLQRNTEDRKREPAKEHEHPVQRSNKQFLHEPESVAPFIEPNVREDH